MNKLFRSLQHQTNIKNSSPIISHNLYIAQGISWVKGSVCFVLKFAFPPFSPLECRFQNKTCTEPLTQGLTWPLYSRAEYALDRSCATRALANGEPRNLCKRTLIICVRQNVSREAASPIWLRGNGATTMSLLATQTRRQEQKGRGAIPGNRDSNLIIIVCSSYGKHHYSRKWKKYFWKFFLSSERILAERIDSKHKFWLTRAKLTASEEGIQRYTMIKLSEQFYNYSFQLKPS